jgi:hypothetical protein
MSMAITKTLTLAAVASLSLGACTAMTDGPDGTSLDYQSQRALAAAHGSMHLGGDAGRLATRLSDSDTD